MKLKPCDSCGHDLTAEGRDLFFVARVQIQKATAWTKGEVDRANALAKLEGNTALGRALSDAEPATFIGDRVPALVTHVDLRVCSLCVQHGATAIKSQGGAGGIDLLDLIRASEIGGPRVPSPEKA
jgi:hypothetical protein